MRVRRFEPLSCSISFVPSLLKNGTTLNGISSDITTPKKRNRSEDDIDSSPLLKSNNTPTTPTTEEVKSHEIIWECDKTIKNPRIMEQASTITQWILHFRMDLGDLPLKDFQKCFKDSNVCKYNTIFDLITLTIFYF